ncbi:MAG: tetratricopeptide repeat protein [Azospirillaceae bacterium]|nr:tetratricopeptide repeat protein [Azospirillaceae bacterium]
MTDFLREVEEDVRREQYHKLWQRYGSVAVLAVVLIILGAVGFQFWHNWRARQATETTAALATALAQSSSDAKAAETALAAVAAKGGDQALLARLYEGAAKAKAGDRAGAAAIYRQVADDTHASDLYRDLGTLLAVLARVDDTDPAMLNVELLPLMADTNPWRYTARELAAIAAVRAKDYDKARTILKSLQDDPGTPPSLRRRAGELADLYAEAK